MAKSDSPVTASDLDATQHRVEQGFYARWSQRKTAYLKETSVQQNNEQLRAHESPPQTDPDTHDEPVLPPVDSLTEHSDLSDFMREQVAEELRLLALRKVFHTPRFNMCDGLDDYAENYRNFEPLGDIITADMRYQLERLEQKKAEQIQAEKQHAEQMNDEQLNHERVQTIETQESSTQTEQTATQSSETSEHQAMDTTPDDELTALHSQHAVTRHETKTE